MIRPWKPSRATVWGEATKWTMKACHVAPVTVVDKGQLVNLPDRTIAHPRFPDLEWARPRLRKRRHAGRPRETCLSGLPRPARAEELKKQLIDQCRDRGLKYGYFVDTLGPRLTPRLLYRVWADDGHEELVRGAIFNELDTRAMRSDLVAAGNDPLVSNRTGIPFMSIVSPSVLFDELEVKRADNSNEKLPDYPVPALVSGRN